MAKFKFSHKYKDKELNRPVEAAEEVEMTIKRADEIVETIRKFKGYENFNYERLDKPKKRDNDGD